MDDKTSEKKATITLDAANSDPKFPAYQLSINAMSNETSGHGYRLLGPKYIGRSRNLRTVQLSQRDADEIRAVLDEVFPASEAADETAEVVKLREQVASVRAWATSHEYKWLHELLDGYGTHGGHL
ncbi:hypothetical protein ACFQ6Q_00120 [Streptomyces sp. NPDC056437]|uniref:hypothetical protein n=1 Tax=Streptomyces sp. NPDC056437 TaxID=3345816 RepID=UPI003688E9F3